MKKDSGIIKFKISLGKFQADINLDPPQKNILALTGKSGSGNMWNTQTSLRRNSHK